MHWCMYWHTYTHTLLCYLLSLSSCWNHFLSASSPYPSTHNFRPITHFQTLSIIPSTPTPRGHILSLPCFILNDTHTYLHFPMSYLALRWYSVSPVVIPSYSNQPHVPETRYQYLYVHLCPYIPPSSPFLHPTPYLASFCSIYNLPLVTPSFLSHF